MAPPRRIGSTVTRAVTFGLSLILIIPALAAERLPSGRFLQDYARANGWSIQRVSADKAGHKILYCWASWTRESDLYVYVSLDPTKREFAYGIPTGIPSGRRQATLRVWFDDAKADAAILQATYVRTPHSGDGDDGYLVASEAGDKPNAAERLAKARKVTFAYPFDGKTRVEAFPYRNGAKAMAKLAACAKGR